MTNTLARVPLWVPLIGLLMAMLTAALVIYTGDLGDGPVVHTQGPQPAVVDLRGSQDTVVVETEQGRVIISDRGVTIHAP